MPSLLDTRDSDCNEIGRNVREVPTDGCDSELDWSQGLAALHSPTRGTGEASGSLLTKVIEGEIIPKLMLAHRSAQVAKLPNRSTDDLSDSGTSETFAELVLTHEATEIVEKIEILLKRGITLQHIFIDLLAPVSRMLGSFWEEDRCTFADVTIGVARLHQVLHEISRRESDGLERVHPRGRIFLAPSPGEQHTFGLSMLEEFFLHAGWETACNRSASAQSILSTAASERLDIIGFSIASTEFLGSLNDLILRARAVSRNRDVTVFVGGRIFTDHPQLAASIVGATVVSDGVRAVQIAETMLSGEPRSGGVERRI